jgi:hypothetical protein
VLKLFLLFYFFSRSGLVPVFLLKLFQKAKVLMPLWDAVFVLLLARPSERSDNTGHSACSWAFFRCGGQQGPRSVGSRPNDNPTTLASVVRHGGMCPCTLQVGQVRLPVSAHPSPLFGSCLMREAACRFVVLDLLFDMYPARCGGLRAYGSRFKLLSSIHHKRVPVCLNFHLNGRFFHVKKDVEISSEQFC